MLSTVFNNILIIILKFSYIIYLHADLGCRFKQPVEKAQAIY